MRRCIVIPAVLIGLSQLVSCGDKGQPEAAAKPSPRAPGAPVQLSAAQREFLTIQAVAASEAVETVSLPGRVTFRPQAQSAVGAPLAGRIAEISVRVGEVVAAGAPLLTIDSAEAAAARAALDQAGTRLAAAESASRRQAEMVARGVGLEFERQEAEARLKEARAEYARARQAVHLIGSGQGSRIVVRAPANGVVMAIRAAVGASVAPGGEPLVELGDPSRLLVMAQVPESEVRRLAVGQDAEIEIAALAARVAARIESFSPRVEAESRRTQVYLALAKPVEGLRAGMMTQVALRVGSEAGIVVPVSAVLIKEGKRRVVYVERPDGTFEAREVRTGSSREGQVTILQGLSAGDRVVVRGGLLLDTQAEQLL